MYTVMFLNTDCHTVHTYRHTEGNIGNTCTVDWDVYSIVYNNNYIHSCNSSPAKDVWKWKGTITYSKGYGLYVPLVLHNNNNGRKQWRENNVTCSPVK